MKFDATLCALSLLALSATAPLAQAQSVRTEKNLSLELANRIAAAA